MLLICLCGNSIAAQVDGTIKLTISPKNSFVRVNGQVLEVSKENTLELPSGEYEIEVWAPRFKVFKENITISPGKELDYRKGLTVLDSSFNDSRDGDVAYRNARLKRNLNIGGIIAVNAITTTIFQVALNSGTDRKKRDAEVARNNYELAIDPDEIAFWENEYSDTRNRYEKSVDQRNNAIKFGLPVIIAGYGLSTYFLIKLISKKIEQPERYSPENPFLTFVEKYQPSLIASTSQIGLGINLKF